MEQGEDEFTLETFNPTGDDEEEIEQVKAKLLHSHLPNLDEAGYIEWDPETKTIRRGPKFEEIAPLLKLMDKHKKRIAS